MKSLEELRQEIDRVDKELLKLFVERMGICSQVADYKRKIGMPVLDVKRERDFCLPRWNFFRIRN